MSWPATVRSTSSASATDPTTRRVDAASSSAADEFRCMSSMVTSWPRASSRRTRCAPVVLAAAPTVAGWVTAGRYDLGFMLVLAACISGCVKVIQSIPRVVIIGCGSRRTVALLNGLGWLGIMISTIGGFVGSGWGLIGLVLGVALGGFLISVPMVLMAAKAVHHFTTENLVTREGTNRPVS